MGKPLYSEVMNPLGWDNAGQIDLVREEPHDQDSDQSIVATVANEGIIPEKEWKVMFIDETETVVGVGPAARNTKRAPGLVRKVR